MASGIYGLSGSGMDIDSLVKNMMKTQQSKYDNIYKNKVQTEWKKSDYNSIYKSLNTFRFSTLSNYKLQSNMAARSATAQDTTIATAVANGDAGEMTHDISVTKLAQNAYLQSTAITRDNATAPKSINLPDVINVQYPAGITDEEKKTKIGLSFTVNDGSNTAQTISYTYSQLEGKTLNDVASDINKLNINITASYDAVNDTFSLYNKKGGSTNTVGIAVNAGSVENPISTEGQANTEKLFTNLKLASYDSVNKTLGSEIALTAATPISVAGVSAEAKIDGKIYTADSNKITAAGVTYTLNKIGETKVNVTNDVDKIVENVKKFVEDYNKMLDTMNSKISETRYKDYKPLTDDEKAAMKEDQVKSWEEKAKSGLLNNDTIIRGVVYDMRDALSDSIDGLTGKYTSAASIGITTTSYTEKGKIQLDENKLRNALKEDPDVVYKIFGTTGSDRDSQGIANRLSAVAQTGMTNISKEAGISSSDDQSVLGIKIDSYESQMKKMLDIMDKRQTQLYKQFSAMETAIASLNSQYSFVNQYTSGS